MFRKLMVLVSALVLASAAAVALAAETATPKEAKSKVEAAAKLLAEKGPAAFPTFRDKKGAFIWKDSYVVVGDLAGNILVHPIVPKLEGKNMLKAKDAKGSLFHAEVVNLAKTKGHGWSEYWWVHPVSKKMTQKVSYIMKVPGKDWLVLAGVWNMTKAQAEAAAK